LYCPYHELAIKGARINDATIRVIRSPEEIEEVRAQWTSWQHHPTSDSDFYLEVNRSRRPAIVRPHILLLNRDGRPDAMLIGRLEKTRMEVRFAHKELPGPKVTSLTFIYKGLLGNASSENSLAFVGEISKSLRQNEVDVARFEFVNTDSPLFSSIQCGDSAATRDFFPTIQAHWSMKLPDTVDKISSEFSREDRRLSKKLLADYCGDVRIACLREPADLERIFRDVEQIAKLTYQRDLGVGFLDNFGRRHDVQFALQKGWHRTFILYAADKPFAFWTGNVYGGVFYVSHTAYDPSYRKYSPGTFVTMKTMEELWKEGVKEFDFGFGDSWYKQRLGTYSWNEALTYMFSPRLRGLTVNALRTPTIFGDRLLRRVLQRTALLPRVKKIFKRRK
jgi:CelD/BcsL family acetyltransferase involved in cellulose biosynthesis